MVRGDQINKPMREAAGEPKLFRCHSQFCRIQDAPGTDIFIGRAMIADEGEFHVAVTRLIELYNEQENFETRFEFSKQPK